MPSRSWVGRFCWLLLFSLAAQLSPAQTAPFAFSHFTLDNNLYARTLMRDSKGFLWIGSDGLFRYDGVSIRRFIHDPKNPLSLSSNIVKTIIEDPAGRIWIGTIKGISRYDPSTDRFTNFKPDASDLLHPRARLDNTLYLDNDGLIWCGDQSGISRFDDRTGRFVSYDLSRYQLPGHRRGSFVTHITDDAQNKGWFWLSSYDGLVHFNKNTGLARYYYPQGAPLTLNSLLQDSQGRLWISTWGRGLGRFEPASGSFSFFPFEKNLQYGSDNIVFGVQENIISKDSSLFFISTNRGLALLDLRQGNKINYDTFLTHTPDDAKSIGGLPQQTLIDRQGIIWVATSNDISYILPATQVFHKVSSAPPEASINTIAEEKETQGGRYRYWLSCWYAGGPILCDENFTPRKVQPPPPYGTSADSKQINQIYPGPAGKDLWLATMDGLYKWDRAKGTIRTFQPDSADAGSLPARQVMCILIDHQQRLWAGTYSRGLCAISTKDNTYVKLPAKIRELLGRKRIFCFYEDDRQRIWMGCANLLLRLDEKDSSWHIYEHEKNNIKSKAEGDVNGITQDRNGTIWIGNDEGLNRFNEPGNDFDLVTTADGLSNDHIYSLVCDREGMLWIGSSSGLNQLDPATGKIKNFYDIDGLQSNDASNALFIRHQGEIVLAGTGGYLTLFDPQKMYRNAAKPPVLITSFKLFNKSDKRQSYFPMPKELHLAYNENYFSIDFIALNLMNAAANRYAYRLTGLDKEWIQSGTEHNVTYSNLGDGKYIFRVKASNNDGIWNEQGASLVIIISPPFWKTWWFIVLSFLALMAAVYGIYSYRLEQLLRVERLRTKISTDLHDDIGSTLSAISIMSELVLHKREKAQWVEMLGEIKDNAISLMEKMDDIVWSINPKNDSLEDLLSRITRFATQLFEAKDIDHSVSIQPHIRELKLSMESRQHLYLMIKETINNVIKHADCNKASMSVTNRDHLLSVVIDDNGKGFRADKASQGNGLINLREQAAKMGATVRIDSRPGQGTRVTISIKIK